MAGFLFSNVSKEISYNNLKNVLGFKGVMSVKNYIQFMQESYLIFELFKYDWSLKKQYVSDKKIYAIDNGLRNAVAFSTSSDDGRMLENLVFLELKRRGKEVFYHKEKKECDFLVKEKNKIVSAIQVVFVLDENNEAREKAGLFEAMERFSLKKGTILTKSRKETIKEGRKTIDIIPVWEWLLEKY